MHFLLLDQLRQQHRRREEAAKLAANKRARDAEEARIASERKAEDVRIAAEKRAAAELKAAFGEAAVLCVQDDDDNSGQTSGGSQGFSWSF